MMHCECHPVACGYALVAMVVVLYVEKTCTHTLYVEKTCTRKPWRSVSLVYR
jgi:hypothetical protein